MLNRTLAELDRQWAEIEASPTAVEALEHWKDHEPALEGLQTLGELLAKRQAEPDSAPAMLAALSRLAAAGDKLAARTLLHALVPGLVVLASGPLAGDPGALDEVLGLAWERICTYPTHRPGSVAANVLWDVRKGYRKHHAGGRPVHKLGGPATCGHAPSAEDEAMRRGLVDDLVAARQAGVISGAGLELIVRTRLHGVPLREVAADSHVSARWANCVRWRAEQSLRPVLAEAS